MFLIQTTQEAEQAYEERKQELTIQRKRFDKELFGLQNGLTEVQDRIDNLKSEMGGDTQFGTNSKVMSQELELNIRNKIKEVYTNVVFHGERKVVETNSSAINLLAELENECERLIKKIVDYTETEGEEVVNKYSKEIQKERQNLKIKKNLKEQREIELKRQKNESNKKSRVIEIKRRAVFRSKPKTIKKKVSNDNKLSQEDIDKQYYIGIY